MDDGNKLKNLLNIIVKSIKSYAVDEDSAHSTCVVDCRKILPVGSDVPDLEQRNATVIPQLETLLEFFIAEGAALKTKQSAILSSLLELKLNCERLEKSLASLPPSSQTRMSAVIKSNKDLQSEKKTLLHDVNKSISFISKVKGFLMHMDHDDMASPLNRHSHPKTILGQVLELTLVIIPHKNSGISVESILSQCDCILDVAKSNDCESCEVRELDILTVKKAEGRNVSFDGDLSCPAINTDRMLTVERSESVSNDDNLAPDQLPMCNKPPVSPVVSPQCPLTFHSSSIAHSTDGVTASDARNSRDSISHANHNNNNNNNKNVKTRPDNLTHDFVANGATITAADFPHLPVILSHEDITTRSDTSRFPVEFLNVSVQSQQFSKDVTDFSSVVASTFKVRPLDSSEEIVSTVTLTPKANNKGLARRNDDNDANSSAGPEKFTATVDVTRYGEPWNINAISEVSKEFLSRVDPEINEHAAAATTSYNHSKNSDDDDLEVVFESHTTSRGLSQLIHYNITSEKNPDISRPRGNETNLMINENSGTDDSRSCFNGVQTNPNQTGHSNVVEEGSFNMHNPHTGMSVQQRHMSHVTPVESSLDDFFRFIIDSSCSSFQDMLMAYGSTAKRLDDFSYRIVQSPQVVIGNGHPQIHCCKPAVGVVLLFSVPQNQPSLRGTTAVSPGQPANLWTSTAQQSQTIIQYFGYGTTTEAAVKSAIRAILADWSALRHISSFAECFAVAPMTDPSLLEIFSGHVCGGGKTWRGFARYLRGPFMHILQFLKQPPHPPFGNSWNTIDHFLKYTLARAAALSPSVSDWLPEKHAFSPIPFVDEFNRHHHDANGTVGFDVTEQTKEGRHWVMLAYRVSTNDTMTSWGLGFSLAAAYKDAIITLYKDKPDLVTLFGKLFQNVTL